MFNNTLDFNIYIFFNTCIYIYLIIYIIILYIQYIYIYIYNFYIHISHTLFLFSPVDTYCLGRSSKASDWMVRRWHPSTIPARQNVDVAPVVFVFFLNGKNGGLFILVQHG